MSRPAGTALPPPPLADEQVLRRLSLDVWRRLSGLLQGDHLGRTPGPGSDPAEARTYVPGDDVRRIDWAVTSRTGETHVRRTTAERELTTTVVLDLSASMSFGTSGAEKRELAIAAATGVLHVLSGPGDRSGVLVVGADRLQRLPAGSGRAAVVGTLTALAGETRADGPGPTLADALRRLLTEPRRPGLVVVVSDLVGDPDWAEPLRRLAQHSEVLVCEVQDPRELTLPAVGVLTLVDPESGRHEQVRLTAGLRARYTAVAAERRAGLGRLLRSAGAGHAVLRTDQDWVAALARGLQARRRTRGRAVPWTG